MFFTNLVSSNLDLQIRGNKISVVETFKLVVVQVDLELKFDEHASNICKKINQKCVIISKIYIFPQNLWRFYSNQLFLFIFINFHPFLSINQTSL